MTTNYLTCPIPAGHPSHYLYYDRKSVDEILDMIRKRNKPTHDHSGYRLLDTAIETYKRLFKPFGESKRKILERKKKTRRYVYTIFNLQMTPLGAWDTKDKAVKLLKQDRIPYTIFDKPMKIQPGSSLEKINPVPVGSTVIRIPVIGSRMNIDHDRYLKPGDPEFYQFRVATKRCGQCPRANDPSAPECGCSLINNIRDQTPGWTLQTEHQLLMKKHRDRKKKQTVVEVSIDELFK